MKKVFSLILAILLCISMNACGEEPTVVDPLIGTWQIKTTDFESEFVFQTEGEKIVGSWTYYDYAEDTWGNFNFTVKEKTDSTIVLLIEDGTMEEMYYTFYGNHLYLDGVLYSNPALQDVTMQESAESLLMLVDGRPLQIYRGIFLGMHATDVIAAMGQNLYIESTGESSSSHNYRYSFTCDYEAECEVDDEFYHADFGFDENMRLVHLHLQGSYEQSTVSAHIAAFTDLFRQEYTLSTESDEFYNRDYYSWEYGDFTIQLTAATHVDFSDNGYYTIAYFYNPKSS